MEPAKKPAPASLLIVQDFVNTAKLLYEQEGLVDPEVLREWLTARGLIEPEDAVGDADLDTAIEVRESLRALMLANVHGSTDTGAVEVFNRTLKDADVSLGLGDDGRPAITTRAAGVDGALGAIASVALIGMLDGSWDRLKACANTACQWSFYDRSANRTGTWCEMGICGSRAKMRAYRRRRQGSAERLDRAG